MKWWIIQIPHSLNLRNVWQDVNVGQHKVGVSDYLSHYCNNYNNHINQQQLQKLFFIFLISLPLKKQTWLVINLFKQIISMETFCNPCKSFLLKGNNLTLSSRITCSLFFYCWTNWGKNASSSSPPVPVVTAAPAAESVWFSSCVVSKNSFLFIN